MTSPISHSIINQPVAGAMDFCQALEALAGGLKVTRLDWNDPAIYTVFQDGLLCLSYPDREYQLYPWHISLGDLAGTDWVTVP